MTSTVHSRCKNKDEMTDGLSTDMQSIWLCSAPTGGEKRSSQKSGHRRDLIR